MRQVRALLVFLACCLFLAGCQSGSNGGQTKQDEAAPAADENVQHAEADPAEASKTGAGDADQEKFEAGDVPPVGSKLELSEDEWRDRLTETEFKILRESGTEPAGTGDLLHNKKKGIYYCAGCGAPLYSSRAKYKSGTGWPSFYEPYEEGRVGEKVDNSLGMKRTEVYCARCGGHLGHVFEDGPPPTGRRHCINSAALDFKSIEEIRASTSSDSSPDNAEGAQGQADETDSSGGSENESESADKDESKPQ